MTFEKALAELVYDNGERDWDNCMFDMAQGVYARCKEALEKQIPKKPIDYDYVLPVYDGDGCQVDAMFMYKAKCPSCGEIIADGELEKSDLVEEKFCRNCGQRIDFSDDEYEAYQDEMGGMAEVVAIEVDE